MTLRNRRRGLAAFALWILGWSATYILLGFILVNRGFIAFVWPAYELAVSVFHADPAGPAVRISVAVFVGLIWAPLPLGVVKRRPELIVLPFCILFANWFSGLMWGHVHMGKL
jgi:hypothetical protein